MNETTPLNGVLIFYIDVGQLAPYKAEALLSHMKTAILEQDNFGDRLEKQNYKILFIPVRGAEFCRTELIKF